MGGCLPSCVQWPGQNCRGEKYEYTVLDGEKSGKKKFIWPGVASSVYMPIPCSAIPESLQHDVSLLKSAMAGLGTNEDQIVRVLCNRSSAQIVTIAQMFEKDTGTSLLAALEEELSGDFKDGVLALVKGQARVDAEVLYDALTGVGTDEERLNEILTGRHPGQIEDIKAEYLQLGDNAEKQQTLWDAVCADTEFKYLLRQIFLLTLPPLRSTDLFDGAGTSAFSSRCSTAPDSSPSCATRPCLGASTISRIFPASGPKTSCCSASCSASTATTTA